MRNTTWLIGWTGATIAFAILLACFVLLLVFWRKRLLIGAVLSTVLLLALSAITWRGMYFFGQLHIACGYQSPTEVRRFSILAAFGRGGVFFGYWDQHDPTLQGWREGTAPNIVWYPGTEMDGSLYPEIGHTPDFDRWGFKGSFWKEAPKKKYTWRSAAFGLVFPFWAAIPPLLLFPALYGRRRWLVPAKRRRLNLCPNCAFSLTGHQNPDRLDDQGFAHCPECNAPFKPKLPVSAK